MKTRDIKRLVIKVIKEYGKEGKIDVMVLYDIIRDCLNCSYWKVITIVNDMVQERVLIERRDQTIRIKG